MFITYTYSNGKPIKAEDIAEEIEEFRQCVFSTSESLFKGGRMMKFFLKVLMFPVRKKMLDNVTKEVSEHYIEVSFPLYNAVSGLCPRLAKLDGYVVGVFQIAFHIKDKSFLPVNKNGKVTYHKNDKSKD